MFRQSIDKGCYGHINEYKKKRLTAALICLAVIAAFVIITFAVFHTRKSVFTILACVMAIPFAERMIGYAIVYNYRSLPEDIYKKINESKYSKEFLYDVTVSDGEKIHYYPCIFLSLEGVAVFDTDVSDKEKRIAAIRKIFDMEELECEIITDVDEFLGLFDEETKSDQGMKEHILTYGV